MTIGPDGSLTPLLTTRVLLGVVTHPRPGLDVYAYAGQEQVSANYWTIGTTTGRLRQPELRQQRLPRGERGRWVGRLHTAITATACTADVKRVQQLTVGFWQDAYKGEMGRLVFGMQYEYFRLDAFPGLPTGTGTPNQALSPNNQILMTSVRYYPFQ